MKKDLTNKWRNRGVEPEKQENPLLIQVGKKGQSIELFNGIRL